MNSFLSLSLGKKQNKKTVFHIIIYLFIIYYFLFSFEDISTDLNFLSSTDVNRLRDGQVFTDKYDMMGLKAALGVVNFCANMLNVRKDVTDSALKFLLSCIENRKNPSSLFKENKLILECYDSENCADEEKMLHREECNFPKIGGATNEIVSTIETDESLDLDKFSTPAVDDNINFDFSELIDADTFLAAREDDDAQKKT